jgi:large subunit ribosomal protein L6
MSRIGRMPIEIPAGVDIKINGQTVTVKGPKGTLTQEVHKNMTAGAKSKAPLMNQSSARTT